MQVRERKEEDTQTDDNALNDNSNFLYQPLPPANDASTTLEEPVFQMPSLSYHRIIDGVRIYLLHPALLVELVWCVMMFCFGSRFPSSIFMLNTLQRKIPYQKTSEGDVILDDYWNNPLLDHETVPDWALSVFFVWLPCICLPMLALLCGPPHDVHASACTILLSVGMAAFVTDSVKMYDGYLRPNFYQYCDFDSKSLSCSSGSNDPRKSFPSGHSSISFASMTLVALYLVGKVGLHREVMTMAASVGGGSSSGSEAAVARRLSGPMPSVGMKFVGLTVWSVPLLLALFVAASRVRDNMHHPADIVAGALIGMLCAHFSHCLW